MMMNIKSKVSSLLLVSAIGFGFGSCSKPIEEKMDDAESKVEEKQDEVTEAKVDLYQVASDSATQVTEYLMVTKERLKANTQSLEEIKEGFSSDKTDRKLAYDEELTSLINQNRALIAVVNDTPAIRSDTWKNVRVELNQQMDDLEKSIAELKEKVTIKP
ncbi:hypothetical protein [Aquiflexum gelatinilyticum]|uniref:hypothetical protein n=1 Tax=Aquiflexum gelatinilyticum TaxID=2961943 RepID=UPI0021691DF2|nr:hypothetical protein [Aquiflexum gelatinilyticum]MCS4436309.1 hypothetical protein [Aquiflexum gelatinilyticum]